MIFASIHFLFIVAFDEHYNLTIGKFGHINLPVDESFTLATEFTDGPPAWQSIARQTIVYRYHISAVFRLYLHNHTIFSFPIEAKNSDRSYTGTPLFLFVTINAISTSWNMATSSISSNLSSFVNMPFEPVGQKLHR